MFYWIFLQGDYSTQNIGGELRENIGLTTILYCDNDIISTNVL